MPIYEYKCTDCSTQFELRHGFDTETELPCPKCKGKTRRVFSAVPIIFKGSGFYTTDSRKKSPKPTAAKPSQVKPNK